MLVVLTPAQVAQLEPILQLLRGDAIEPHLEGEDLAEFEADRTTFEVAPPEAFRCGGSAAEDREFAMQVGSGGAVNAIDAPIRLIFRRHEAGSRYHRCAP